MSIKFSVIIPCYNISKMVSSLINSIIQSKIKPDEIIFVNDCSTDNTLELNQRERERIFNLGYYTWVEQQSIDINEFEKRRDQSFWDEHHNYMLSLDNRIKEFNSM